MDQIQISFPIELAQRSIADKNLNSIWIGFLSKVQKRYTAVYVFEHPVTGGHILLIGGDKDGDDFVKVASALVKDAKGDVDIAKKVCDRGADICLCIPIRDVPDKRQMWVVEKMVTFYARNFFNVSMEAIYPKT